MVNKTCIFPLCVLAGVGVTDVIAAPGFIPLQDVRLLAAYAQAEGYDPVERELVPPPFPDHDLALEAFSGSLGLLPVASARASQTSSLQPDAWFVEGKSDIYFGAEAYSSPNSSASAFTSFAGRFYLEQPTLVYVDAHFAGPEFTLNHFLLYNETAGMDLISFDGTLGSVYEQLLLSPGAYLVEAETLTATVHPPHSLGMGAGGVFHIRLDIVPEPATGVTLMLAGVALLLRRKFS